MRRIASFLTVALLAAGCTAGRDYAGPPVAAPRAAGAATFVRAQDLTVAAAPPIARWWETLNDATLSALEMRALADNADVAAARARLEQARAALGGERANGLPSLKGNAAYIHAHFPGLDLNSSSADGSQSGDSTTDLNLYNVGLNASWEVDLFGAQRRAVETARATAQASEASLADAQVSLTAEIAQAYLNVRDRQPRITLADRSVALQQRMLALTQQRVDRGTAGQADIERLNQQLDSTRADASLLHAELDAYLDELATLTGAEPGALDGMLGAAAPPPLPPAQLAIGDPAALLQRRPDIRAAERTLAADTAKIGQAEAARFPKLSFMGIVGIGGTRPSDLTHLDDFTALLAPQLSWSFLDFGRNAAHVRQVEAVRDEAEAKYRSAVLSALRDAEDALSRFRNRRILVAIRARTRESAARATGLARQRYAAGTATLIDVLDAERRQVEAEQGLVSAQAALTGDYVTIQKTLGLGWSAPERGGAAGSAEQIAKRGQTRIK